MKATLFSANQKAQKTIEMEKLVGLIRDGYKESKWQPCAKNCATPFPEFR